MTEKQIPPALTSAEAELVTAISKLDPSLQREVADFFEATTFDICLVSTKEDYQTLKALVEDKLDAAQDADTRARLSAVIRAISQRRKEMSD